MKPKGTLLHPRFLSLALIASLSILSCSSPKNLEYRSIHNISLLKLGYDHSTLSVEMEFYNPNNFGLQLRRSNLDLYINGAFLGHSSFDSLIRIPRRDSFLIPVSFDLNMQNLYRNIWATLGGREAIFRLTGNLTIGKASIFMNMPVDYETKQYFSFF